MKSEEVELKGKEFKGENFLGLDEKRELKE